MAYNVSSSSPTMARNTSRRVSFSPCTAHFRADKRAQLTKKSRGHGSGKEGASLVELFHSICGKVVRALRLAPAGRKVSPKYCSDPFAPRPFEPLVDAHRTQAIEECIEFLNSRRSFHRSYSLSECSLC